MNEQEVETLLRSFRPGDAPALPAPRGRWGALSVAIAAAALVALVIVIVVPAGDGVKATPAAAQDDAEVRALIERLSSDDVAVREAASAELRKRGEAIVPLLKAEAARAKDPEVAARLKDLIGDLAPPGIERVKEIALEEGWTASAVAWTPDGKSLLVAGGGETPELRAYDTTTWAVRGFDMPVMGRRVNAVSVSADGAHALVAHSGGAVAVDLTTLATRTIMRRGLGFQSAQFTGGNQMLFAGLDGEDRSRMLLVAMEGASIAERSTDNPGMLKLAVARGRELAAATGLKRVHVLNINTLVEVRLLTVPGTDAAQEAGWATTSGEVVFSGDEKWLAVEGWGGAIAVMECEGWREAASWYPHGTRTKPRLAFAHDSRHLITAAADGRIRVWRAGKWKREAASVAHEGEATLLQACAADGRFVAGASGGRALCVYRLREP